MRVCRAVTVFCPCLHVYCRAAGRLVVAMAIPGNVLALVLGRQGLTLLLKRVLSTSVQDKCVAHTISTCALLGRRFGDTCGFNH
jgi:hypothetical protein